MAITPDKDILNNTSSALIESTIKQVGDKIKKKIVDSSVLVDPCPGPGTEIIKSVEK